MMYTEYYSMYTVQEPSGFAVPPLRKSPPQKVTQRNKIQNKHSSNIFFKKIKRKKLNKKK